MSDARSLVVVRGDATPEEIAAVLAVLGAAQPAPPSPAISKSEWAAHYRKVRGPHQHGRGSWRSSALPR